MIVLDELMHFATQTLAQVARVFSHRYEAGILAVVCSASLCGAGVAQTNDPQSRDFDIEVVQKNASVEVRNRGPITLAYTSTSNRYGGRNHKFRTIVETDAGAQEIGFVIQNVSGRDNIDRSAICPSVPGPAGLREMIDADAMGEHKVISCSVPASTVSYKSPADDGPATTISCTYTVSGTRTPCGMRIYYGRYSLKVFMWDVPPEDWRVTRDQVVAVIDQSFDIVDRE